MFALRSLAVVLCGISMLPALAKGPAATTPKDARKDPDFLLQGEYQGELGDNRVTVGLQLVAQGEGKFKSRGFVGGLPGEGWDGEKQALRDAELTAAGVVMIRGDRATGILKGGQITVSVGGNEVGVLKRVQRKSKTLRAKPPEGAVVLFDGSSSNHWNSAVMDGKTLAFDPQGRGATSKQVFGSHQLHLEFRLPYMPQARGQGRGNSGLYLQSRYEVQMLDSFGLEGEQNECGGVYSIAKPKLNMCYPPLVWQTYDVDFTAAEYDAAGKVVKHPRMTVQHNGVVIHKDLELPHSTTASPLKPGPQPAPIYLQNHGNPVRYRNIWVLPKE